MLFRCMKQLYRIFEGSCNVETNKIIDTSVSLLLSVQTVRVNSGAISLLHNYNPSTFLGSSPETAHFGSPKISFHPTTHAQISSEFLRADSSQTLCS